MSTEIQPGAIIAQKYRIEESIGVGGFSVVFRATHIAMNRPVAIKIFDAKRQYQADPERAKRNARHFQKEAQLVSRLQHPNTVTIFDYGIHPGGKLYLVMEFIPGKTLADLLTKEKKLPEKRTLSIFLQILASLEEAHHLGILHRDLKPANIMLTHTFKGDEQVKVLDFGIAQFVNQEQQHDRSSSGRPIFLGTPRYAAPEQLRAGRLTCATDIFGVGALLWHCLLGQPMIPTGDIHECIALHRRGRPWVLPQDALVDRELKKIIERAVHLDPKDRFADASQMLAALKIYSQKKQVSPPPLPSSPFRRTSSEIVDPNVVGHDSEENYFLGDEAPAMPPAPAIDRPELKLPQKPEELRQPLIPEQRSPNIELASVSHKAPRPLPEHLRPGQLLPTRSSRIKRRLRRSLLITTTALVISCIIIVTALFILPAETYDEVTEAISSTTTQTISTAKYLSLKTPETPRRSPFTADGIRAAIQTRDWRIENSRDPIDMQRFLFHPITISRDNTFLDLTIYDVQDPSAEEEIIGQVSPPNRALSLGHMVVRINPRDSAGFEAAEQLEDFLTLYRDLVLDESSP